MFACVQVNPACRRRAAGGSYNGEEARREARDEVFPGTGAHDGVVGAGHGGPVVGCHHQTHLNELAGVAW